METLSEHYGRLLGLTDSWSVEGVDLRLDERRVEIRLRQTGKGVACPECGEACPLADHASERRWRHLDMMHFTTELVARLRAVNALSMGSRHWYPPGRASIHDSLFSSKPLRSRCSR